MMTRTTRISLAIACAWIGLAAPARAELGTPVLQWQRCATGFCDTGWYASPAVTTIGGVPHVLGGGYRLIAVRGDTGALQWTYPSAGSAGRMWPGPAIADVDGDGAREIVVVQYDEIAVLDTAGAVEDGWPRSPFGTAEMRTLAVADLDGDGAQEILTARASPGGVNTWTVLAANGTTRAGWPRREAADPGFAAGAFNQNLAAGDLDGDGDLEIAASSDVHYLAAFDDGGSVLPASAIYGAGKAWSQVGVHYDHAVDLRGYANCGVEHRPNFADAPPAIGDLDGDGANEIVLVGSFYDCGTNPYTQLFQLPIVLEADRTRWASGPYDWTELPAPDANAAPLSIDYAVIQSAEANPALADLDGDGVREILHASYDGRVHAWWLDRTEHGVWPFDVNLGSSVLRFASEPAVADLDGDGDGEVLFTTWTANTSNQGGDLFVVDALGHELARVPLPRSAASWDGALGAPTVAQLDADAAMEVVVSTAHTGLVAYEIPGSVATAPRWPTGRGSFARAAPEADRVLSLVGALVTLTSLRRRSRARVPLEGQRHETRPCDARMGSVRFAALGREPSMRAFLTGRTATSLALTAVVLGSSLDAAAMDLLFRVTTTADTGGSSCSSPSGCSFRQAIGAANAAAGLDYISFEISTEGTPVTITPATPLPAITSPVVIDATSNQPFANCFGLDLIVELDGSALSAGADGLVISAGGAGSYVSGLAIGGFPGDGIELAGADNAIFCNRVGTDATGTVARPNGRGIRVTAAGNEIGGTAGNTPNQISASLNEGILVSGTSGTLIRNNVIGAPAIGGSPLLGNAGSGLYLENASSTTIGGPGVGNVIHLNDAPGVLVFGGTSLGNRISQNDLANNGGEGIDLLGADFEDPVDFGDADTGPNRLQNPPAITEATYDANTDAMTVTFRVETDPANATYPITVEFFEADNEGDEGQTYYGSLVFTEADWAAGTPLTASFTQPGASVGDLLQASATDAAGNTSEFPSLGTLVPEPRTLPATGIALLACAVVARHRARD